MKKWQKEVMADAVECQEIDENPDYEASKYNYFYFVIFIVCGSFFTLNCQWWHQWRDWA